MWEDRSPALGPLVIFKRTKLLPAIFLCELSLKQNTFGNSWYRTNRLVYNFYTLDFMNFTAKFCTRQLFTNIHVTQGVQKARILNLWQMYF